MVRLLRLVVVLAVVCSACGSGGEAAEEHSESPNAADVVPRGFASTGDGWSRLVATSSFLVGLGPLRPDVPVPEVLAEAVDLDTGAVRSMGGPTTADGALLVQVASATSGAVLVGGVVCETLILDEDTQCAQQPVSFRLDPTTGVWEQLEVPAGAHDMAYLQAHSDGSAVAVFRGREAADDKVVTVLDGDAWRTVGTLPPGDAIARCATDAALYELRLSGGGQDSASFELSSVSLGDGAAARVPAPSDLLTDFAGAAVKLACAGDAVLLAGPPALGEPVSVNLHRAGSWTTAGAERWSGVPVEALSGESHAVLLLGEPSEPDEPRRTAIALGATGSSIELPGNLVDHRLVWRDADTLLIIGEAGHDPADSSTVPLRHLDLG